jgi:hypothetical protein
MDPVHLHLAEMLKLIPVIPTLKGFFKSFVRENDGIYPSDHVVPLKYLKKNRRISASDCINRHLIPVSFHFDNIHHLTMC